MIHAISNPYSQKFIPKIHYYISAYLLLKVRDNIVLAVWVRNGMDHGHEGINTSKQYKEQVGRYIIMDLRNELSNTSKGP
jgi:hypothetical protein